MAEEIAAKYGRNSTASMQFDVSDEAQCKALVAKTLERFGKIDILVNNAALYAPLEPVSVTDIDVELWDKVMAVNVRGLFMMTKHVAPHMIARKSGKIINIGSGTAARGIPDFAHYVTSKGAVTSFTRAVSRELGQHGICVNTLAPGADHQRSAERGAPASSRGRHRWRAAPSSAIRCPRTWSARWSISRPRTAISSPARCWRWMAGRTTPDWGNRALTQSPAMRIPACGGPTLLKGAGNRYVPGNRRPEESPQGPRIPRRM